MTNRGNTGDLRSLVHGRESMSDAEHAAFKAAIEVALEKTAERIFDLMKVLKARARAPAVRRELKGILLDLLRENPDDEKIDAAFRLADLAHYAEKRRLPGTAKRGAAKRSASSKTRTRRR